MTVVLQAADTRGTKSMVATLCIGRETLRAAMRRPATLLLAGLLLAASAQAGAAEREDAGGAPDENAPAAEASTLAGAVAFGAGASAAVQPAIVKRAQAALRTVQSDYLAPCFKGDHVLCRGNMAELIGRLKTEHQMAVTDWSRFEPVRNNMFFYLVAPSLRLAVAIVKSARECGEWTTLAARAGVSLSELLAAANQEVGGQTALPESKELAYLRTRLSSCPTAGGNE